MFKKIAKNKKWIQANFFIFILVIFADIKLRHRGDP